MQAQEVSASQTRAIGITHPCKIGKLANGLGLDNVPIRGNPFVMLHRVLCRFAHFPDELEKCRPDCPSDGWG